MPLEIAAAAPAAKKTQTPSFSEWWASHNERKPGVKDRMFFTEQLSLLLETGTPMYPALESLKTQTKNPAMVRVIDSLMDDVGEGKPFSVALAKYPALFSVTYINLVSAAEKGGFLDKVLLELMRLDDRREQLHSTVTSALTYPIFLIVFSIAVVVFVLMVVFPKFDDLFSSIRDQLPVTTLFLMNASHVLTKYWMLLGMGLASLAAGFAWWQKTPQGRESLDTLKMNVFYFRTIFIHVYLIQSLRVMGLSMANGVSAIDTLHSCKEVVQNRIYRNFLCEVETKIKEGEGFASAFQEAEFIPATVQQMVKTGEDTGNLPRVLSRVADYYDRELEKRLSMFSRLVEPIMLLVMGGVVGLIVSSLILPIFKLSRAVH